MSKFPSSLSEPTHERVVLIAYVTMTNKVDCWSTEIYYKPNDESYHCSIFIEHNDIPNTLRYVWSQLLIAIYQDKPQEVGFEVMDCSNDEYKQLTDIYSGFIEDVAEMEATK